jgi:hypothetical protein
MGAAKSKLARGAGSQATRTFPSRPSPAVRASRPQPPEETASEARPTPPSESSQPRGPPRFRGPRKVYSNKSGRMLSFGYND